MAEVEYSIRPGAARCEKCGLGKRIEVKVG